MSKVLVLGSLNMDLSINCDRIPDAGETLAGSGFITNPGGKGANQAVAAARLGADVHFIGAVGDDAFGEVLIGCLEGANINTAHIFTSETLPTGTASIIRVDGNNRIILSHGANYALDKDAVLKTIDEVGEAGDIFLAQFENEPELTYAALECAHKHGLFTMINPAPAREIPEDVWPNLDYVCINETECEILCGQYPYGLEDAAEAAKKIHAKGPSQVVITLGSQGAFGSDTEGSFFVPARKVEALDTTAAGDTFIGAMIAGRSRSMGFKESMEYATKASSLTVSRLGAMQSIPSQTEVEELPA